MLTAAAATRFHDLNLTVLPQIPKKLPRCLFGRANPADTENLLKEALDVERSRFQARWGVDSTEDNEKENLLPRREMFERTPKKHTVRQASMHEYWKPRKLSESNKKQNTALEPTICNENNNNDKDPPPLI